MTFTNTFTIAGKVIANTTADTGEHVAYIVSDAHSPNLQNIAEWLRTFNGKSVTLTVTYDVPTGIDCQHLDVSRPTAERPEYVCNVCGARLSWRNGADYCQPCNDKAE